MHESSEHDDHHDHSEARGGVATRIYGELIAHLPFSVSSVAIGLVLAGMICVLIPLGGAPVEQPTGSACAHQHEDEPAGHDHGDHQDCQHEHPEAAPGHTVSENGHSHSHGGHGHNGFALPLFHLFHPVHMFFSAAATTAMFWRFDRRLVKAITIGVLGAVGVCGVSDIIMPYMSQFVLVTLGGLKAEQPLHLHICLIEHPALVLPFAAIGVVVGLTAAVAVERSTLFSHSLHVFSSTMASIFYLIGPFGRTAWVDDLGMVFLLIVLAVMIPCCISDIIFPLALTRDAREAHARTPHHCH